MTLFMIKNLFGCLYGSLKKVGQFFSLEIRCWFIQPRSARYFLQPVYSGAKAGTISSTLLRPSFRIESGIIPSARLSSKEKINPAVRRRQYPAAALKDIMYLFFIHYILRSHSRASKGFWRSPWRGGL
jgi:hypothetical protein